MRGLRKAFEDLTKRSPRIAYALINITYYSAMAILFLYTASTWLIQMLS